MYCKKCGAALSPESDMSDSDDIYYAGGARCRVCDYLYFPNCPPTWNTEPWRADFDRKAGLILRATNFNGSDWHRDAFLVLHFIDCLEKVVTWYFMSPAFTEHERLLEVLTSLGATKSVDTLKCVVRIAKRPEQVLERFGLVGDTSEAVDDAWDEVTEELATSLDADLRKLVYDRFLQDHDLSEFGEE